MAFHKNLEALNLHIQVRFTIQVSKCKSICLSQTFKEWQEGSWFCFSAGSNGFLKSLTPLNRMTFPQKVCCPCGSGEAPSSWLTANVKYQALLLNFYTFLVLQSLSSLHSQNTDCSYYLYGYWGRLALFTLIGSIANWTVFSGLYPLLWCSSCSLHFGGCSLFCPLQNGMQVSSKIACR